MTKSHILRHINTLEAEEGSVAKATRKTKNRHTSSVERIIECPIL